MSQIAPTSADAAQSGPPAAEPVLRQRIESLPSAPAFIALAQFSYAVGAFFPTSAGAGPVTIRILGGRLSFHVDKEVALTRGGPGNPQTTVPAGSDFTVTPGDQVLIPGDVPHTARSEGPDEAATLGVAIFREPPVLDFPPGISFDPLALGMAGSRPTGPVDLELDRLEFPAETGDAAATRTGPGLVHVEAGELELRVERGDVAVVRPVVGPPAAPEPVPAGGGTSLGAGSAVVLQAGSAAAFANRSGGALRLLHATLRPIRAGGEGKDAASAFYYDAWDRRNPDLVDRIFAPGFVNHNPITGQQPGREGIKQWIRSFYQAFPDGSISIDLQIAEADRVVTRYSWRGTHQGQFLGIPATGKPVEVTGIGIFRVQNGQIQEGWGFWEQAGLLLQLGKLPLPGQYPGSQVG
jgi:steroid delta-isomerase-like uncharacterized protein